MKSFIHIFLISMFLVVGCTRNTTKVTLKSAFFPAVKAARKATWNNMIGSWYGSQKIKNGGVYSWTINYMDNGTFRHTGKVVNAPGDVLIQVEVGEWGVGGNMYFDIVKGWIEDDRLTPSDSKDPYFRNIYNILELNDNKLIYKHIDSGETFSTKRVPSDFKMP